MANSAELNSLLRWSIENTTQPAASSSSSGGGAVGSSSAPRAAIHPSDHLLADTAATNATVPTPAPRKDLDPAVLDTILGKSDAVLMREKLEFAQDKSHSIDDRVGALDDFEMLIEQIDNANNIQNMAMWRSLLDLLNDEEDEVVRMAVWICGTAIQNNIKAQENFFAQKPMPSVYSIISGVHPRDSSHPLSAATRSKAVYCLSAALKHWPQATDVLDEESARGWSVIRDGLRDTDATIRRKMAFLINTLLVQAHETDGQTVIMLDRLRTQGLFSELISLLSNPMPSGPDGESTEIDWDFSEKAMRALTTAMEKNGLDGLDKARLTTVINDWTSKGEWENAGFSELEAESVKKLVHA